MQIIMSFVNMVTNCNSVIESTQIYYDLGPYNLA